jgi:iron complex transport system ATP-binding protein
MTTVELAGVSLSYDGVAALRDVSTRFAGGTWTGLIGPNGAGKSSLLRAVAGLVPYGGEIRLGAVAAAKMARRERSRSVAYLPQRSELPEGMTVTDYILLGRTPYIRYLGMETQHDRQVVSRVLERLELGSLAARPLSSLSGGEVQRAILGRALAQEAPVLLLDEPTAALDIGHQQHVLELIDELRQQHRLTVISAMHDLTLAGQFGERLLLLSGGRMVVDGPTEAVLNEGLIREHFGASVRVFRDSLGHIVVIPSRDANAPLASKAPV